MAHSEWLPRPTLITDAFMRIGGSVLSVFRVRGGRIGGNGRSASARPYERTTKDQGRGPSRLHPDDDEHRLHRIADLARWDLIR